MRATAGEIASIAGIWLRRLERFSFRRLLRHGRRFLARRRKGLARRLAVHPSTTRFPVFIHGSNRSGSQMVCRALGDSPHGWDYWEGSSVAFDGFYLRPDRFIERLIRLAPAPIVSFGCILDSQRCDRLLARFDGARAIWVYRRCEDAASSSVRRWGAHQKDLARAVASGDLAPLGPRAEGVSADSRRLFGELFREDLTNEDGGCLYWYLRNSIYFELGLDRDPRVLLLQYEDAVLNSEAAFRRVLDFLGFPYHPEVIGQIFATSVGRHPWPGADSRIAELCGALQARLDARYVATGGTSGQASGRSPRPAPGLSRDRLRAAPSGGEAGRPHPRSPRDA